MRYEYTPPYLMGRNGFVILLTIFLLSSVFINAHLVQRPQRAQPGEAAGIPGNCDGNGSVNVLDYELLSNPFGEIPEDVGYDARCNFVGDPSPPHIDDSPAFMVSSDR
jgi:hypothetical protein